MTLNDAILTKQYVIISETVRDRAKVAINL